MTNANKFKGIFGIYATELWAKPEKEFLEWLNEDVPDTNVGDTISRQAAIDVLVNESSTDGAYGYVDIKSIVRLLNGLPPAQPEIVRCKDCKNHDWCSIEDMALNDETFFCQWGERRE